METSVWGEIWGDVWKFRGKPLNPLVDQKIVPPKIAIENGRTQCSERPILAEIGRLANWPLAVGPWDWLNLRLALLTFLHWIFPHTLRGWCKLYYIISHSTLKVISFHSAVVSWHSAVGDLGASPLIHVDYSGERRNHVAHPLDENKWYMNTH